MLTDFYNIWHSVYWDSMQTKVINFILITAFEHFRRCILRSVGGSKISWVFGTEMRIQTIHDSQRSQFPNAAKLILWSLESWLKNGL